MISFCCIVGLVFLKMIFVHSWFQCIGVAGGGEGASVGAPPGGRIQGAAKLIFSI